MAKDTFSPPSPDRFSPRDRDRFFFFLLPPPSRCLPRCRSRLEEDEEEVAGGGEAERRRLRRFSRDRDLRLPPRRRSELRERRRVERDRERRRADEEVCELGLRSRDRCFLESQGEAGAGGAGWALEEDEAASLASPPLRLRSRLDFLRVGGPAVAAAVAVAVAGEGERWR